MQFGTPPCNVHVKCVQELVCKRESASECQLLPVLPVSLYSVSLNTRRSHGIGGCGFPVYGMHPTWSCHSCHYASQMQQGTASIPQPGVPLPPFPGPLAKRVTQPTVSPFSGGDFGPLLWCGLGSSSYADNVFCPSRAISLCSSFNRVQVVLWRKAARICTLRPGNLK